MKEELRVKREMEKEQKRIEAEKNQKPVKSITISITWVKSRAWGTNPNAEAFVCYHDKTAIRKDKYRASGCQIRQRKHRYSGYF